MEDNRIYEKYKPLSAWAYVGFQILLALPTIGLLLVIVFSIVGDNINMKNFARSYICMAILWFLVFVVCIVILVYTGSLSTILEYISNFIQQYAQY